MSDSKDVFLKQLVKQYGKTIAVNGINLDIPAGSYCCLVGPSGCGKTSTLRMISGHEEVTEGSISIGDQEINNVPPAKRGTAMMFQNYALFPHLNCLDNVAFSMKMKGMTKNERYTSKIFGVGSYGDL
jgi:putative spermidine/putrescine transport system ATP-binding protein